MSRPNPDVVGRRLDDRFVLVNLATNRIYELNATASLVWELLEAGNERSQIEAELEKQFDVEPDQLQKELDEAMRLMSEAGLVTAA